MLALLVRKQRSAPELSHNKSPAALFGWIGLVSIINWCVRVFSNRFKHIETDLVDHEHVDCASNGQSVKKYRLGQLLRTGGLLVPMILLTVFYLFCNIPWWISKSPGYHNQTASFDMSIILLDFK
ncbi:hypothetical protein WP50_23875 [Lactiplantibacillus plantarum]|nr:hypothetical protein WP50_23875 [Lactiplantibacillus plantarum]